MGVVNRDIKPENTLLGGQSMHLLKICDFGYSKHEEDGKPKTILGTPGYTGAHAVDSPQNEYPTFEHILTLRS